MCMSLRKWDTQYPTYFKQQLSSDAAQALEVHCAPAHTLSDFSACSVLGTWLGRCTGAPREQGVVRAQCCSTGLQSLRFIALTGWGMNMFFNRVVAIHFNVKHQLRNIAVSLTETAILKIVHHHFVRLVLEIPKFITFCTLPRSFPAPLYY